jgi:hypothetical protein
VIAEQLRKLLAWKRQQYPTRTTEASKRADPKVSSLCVGLCARIVLTRSPT